MLAKASKLRFLEGPEERGGAAEAAAVRAVGRGAGRQQPLMYECASLRENLQKFTQIAWSIYANQAEFLYMSKLKVW